MGLAAKLIERWSQDPGLQNGVPYRRMASEAAEEAVKIIEELTKEIEEKYKPSMSDE